MTGKHDHGIFGINHLVALALLFAVGLPAASASALDPPELLYREGVSESEPLSPWLPLDGANISSLGFILGTRAQAKPPADSAVYYRLTALAVPDGHPDQGPAFDPAGPCFSTAQTPGKEVVMAIGRFEGPGGYSIRVEANLPSNGATAQSCSGGPASTASFTIDPTITLDLLVSGPTFIFENPFGEIAKIASIPAGGAGETQCTSGEQSTKLLGPTVLVKSIPRTGRWTCVARARVAVSETEDGPHYTRWSAPVAFDAIARFQTAVDVVDKTRPRYTIRYVDMPAGSEGGKITLKISPSKGCPKVKTKTLRATVGPKLRVPFTFRLPEKGKARIGHPGVDAYGWQFDFSFGGTAQVRKAHGVSGGFVNPKRFDFSGLQLPGLKRAYCTRTA